jgi:hypothetical protein
MACLIGHEHPEVVRTIADLINISDENLELGLAIMEDAFRSPEEFAIV